MSKQIKPTGTREPSRDTIRSVRERLHDGRTSSRILVEEALARIFDPEGEGKSTFMKVYAREARHAAIESDDSRAGNAASPIAGLPISIKDLFDVEGELTLAGSIALRNCDPAKRDAEVVSRLKRAGAIIVGRTNMSEFAFTGVGMNPHYGTPANPYDRQRRRIPGGSSSGAPVSITDGMALAAIATDTGGSVRIPAALCGLAGFKPTQKRIPRSGVFPLSPTLDSVGVIANTVACCAEVHAVLAGEKRIESKVELKSKAFAVPKNYFLDDLDRDVSSAFESAISKLSAAGATILDTHLPLVEQIAEINSRGGISAPEAYAFHRQLAADFSEYDPLVRERILRGKDITTAEYLDMLRTREALIQSFNQIADWDILVCPTVPIIAPEISKLEQDAAMYRHTNRLLLRNPNVVNFLDGCALSIPCHEEGEAPVGLMLIARGLQDHMLLNLGITVEEVIASCSKEAFDPSRRSGYF
jgi:aspartyl-tRNA(Asn)/glutamyl-tRNA(Gln) amidotransferase subunit A